VGDVTSDHLERWSARPAARLGAYALVLAASLGGGALVGATVGPEPTDDNEDRHHHAATTVESGGADVQATSPTESPSTDPSPPATSTDPSHDH
jgi:hypothetical protein